MSCYSHATTGFCPDCRVQLIFCKDTIFLKQTNISATFNMLFILKFCNTGRLSPRHGNWRGKASARHGSRQKRKGHMSE